MSYRTWINRLAVLSLMTALGGCTTTSEKLLSHNGNTMRDVWDRQTVGGASQQLMEARLSLRRPVTLDEKSNTQTSYTRTAQNEIYRQFQRLPNPDLVMYVFPHLAGSDPVPVPGYSTVFPLYQRVQYALPGERVEEY
jgi:conjugative transfer region lipoprotein (TIGR03751 family)